MELEQTVRRDPLDAWDVAAIAEEYTSFVDRWSPLLERMRASEVSGVEAVCARTEVMDTYRRFHVLDPRLPMRCMPQGWRRAQVPGHLQRCLRRSRGDGPGACPNGGRVVLDRARRHRRATTADLLAGV
ncbi:PaaX family transcriptional regulator C-terminal domain-containing protein [Streptomyces sp900116325]|uniref:PaaX family transcriptional regulator C-terminal domain-containing protein n=1 Tax=Streptomyces sp. 900116325 TaxID=3154295 RepID=UPI0033B57C27